MIATKRSALPGGRRYCKVTFPHVRVSVRCVDIWSYRKISWPVSARSSAMQCVSVRCAQCYYRMSVLLFLYLPCGKKGIAE
jgi:hypothetical protein